jgi:hypothetical protein
MALPPLGRREFLAASAALLAAACGGDDTSSGGRSSEQFELIAAFPVGEPYVAAGIEQRLPFLVGLAGDAPLDRLDGPVPFSVSTVDGKSVTARRLVAPRGKDLPRAYLPYEVTVPSPGNYLAHATYKGQQLETAFSVVAADQVHIPQVDQKAPAVETPTTTDARGVDPICTRDPQCPFHTIDLTTALRSSKPTVLLIGTPLYCQTAICGPVLELLIEAARGRDDLNVIHAEVYSNPGQVQDIQQATHAPIIGAYGLPFEPIIFGIDPSGTVVRRLDLIWDRSELDGLLRALS